MSQKGLLKIIQEEFVEGTNTKQRPQSKLLIKLNEATRPVWKQVEHRSRKKNNCSLLEYNLL